MYKGLPDKGGKRRKGKIKVKKQKRKISKKVKKYSGSVVKTKI